MHEWEVEALAPGLVVDLEVAVRDEPVLTVPNLKVLAAEHLVQYLQLLDLMLHRFTKTVLAVAGFMLEAAVKDLVDDAGGLHSALVALSSVFEGPDHGLVESVAF